MNTHFGRRTYTVYLFIDTDPDEVGGGHGGAAGAPRLAVHVHAAALLSVPQGELHPSAQVLQAGDAGEVRRAQPQLLHPRRPPLLQTASDQSDRSGRSI